MCRARYRVLVIQPDSGTMAMLELALRSSEFELRRSEDATLALSIVKVYKPDLILVTASVQEVSRMEFASGLRLLRECSPAPIVALGENSDSREQEKAVAAGCLAYAPNTIGLEEFSSLVRALLPPPQDPATDALSEGTGATVEIPGFEQLRMEFINRLKDSLTALQDALARQDFKNLRIVGHNWKGAGTPYGFPRITEYGIALEAKARAGDVEGLASLQRDVRAYLANLQL